MPRILIVDDNETIRDFLTDFLTIHGYQVEVARDGHEALVAYEARPADLVILDIFMPKKDGIETIMALKEAAAPARIIAISGGSPYHDKEAALEMAGLLGAEHCFGKPLPSGKLLSAIRECLAGPESQAKEKAQGEGRPPGG